MSTHRLSLHTPNLSIKYLLCMGGERQMLLHETAQRQLGLHGGRSKGFFESLLS